MAITATARGTATSNTSSTTFTLTPSGNLAAGSLAVLVVSADNSAASGSSNNINSVSDTKGNTWTKRRSPLYDPGAASAGIQGAIFDSKMGAGALTTGDTITVTLGANTTAKTAALWQLASAAGTQPAYQTGGEGTGSATTTPTVTTSSLTNGDAVVGGLFNEYGTAQTVTGDSDTTNGSWSSQQTTEIGTTTSGNTISTQVKVVSATATQTYNPTLGTSSDVILSWASYRETSNTQTVTLGLLDGAPALYAPTLTQPWVPSNDYETEVDADNPVFFAPMTESSGNITDVIGGKVGTANGTPTYSETGPFGSVTGISFNNIADFFSFSDHADLDLGNGPFTIEFWLRRDADNGNQQGVVRKGTGAYAVNIGGSSDAVGLGKQGTAFIAYANTTTPANSTWHHYAITYNGTTTGIVYTDGVAGTTQSSSQTLTNTSTAMEVGKDDSTLDGALYGLAIYPAVLSAARVAAHFDAAGGTQSITVPLLDASPALYAPTLTPKNLISLGLIDASPALYAPTLYGYVPIALPLLDGAPALYAPTLTPKNLISLGLLDGAPALYAPTLTPKNLISLGLIDASPALYAPTLSTISYITLSLLDGSPALYAPTFAQAGGVQSITLGLLDGSPALYAPIVTPTVTFTLPLLDAGSALYAPTVIIDQFITLSLLDAAPTLYAPTLTPKNLISLGLIDAAPALYAPTLTPKNTITLGFLDAAPALYAPTIGQFSQISLPLLDAGSSLYAPTLTTVAFITLPLLDAGAALYSPTIVPLNLITLPLLDAGGALYAPTLVVGSAVIYLPLLDASSALYAPTLTLVLDPAQALADAITLQEFWPRYRKVRDHRTL